MPDVDVAIVGGGAAGLAALREIRKAGRSALLLEARDRLGGRIHTVREPSLPVPIELGAEFVHGSAEATRTLAREARLTLYDIEGDRFRSEPKRLVPFEDFFEQLDRVMRHLDEDRTPDRSFAEFLATRPGGRMAARQRNLAEQWVRGFHAADPARISERALAAGGSPGDDEAEQQQSRIGEGSDRLVAHLASNDAAAIRTSAVVTRVEWSRGSARMFVRDARGDVPSAVHARSLIVTVPSGVLQAPAGEPGAIAFDPPLPAAHRRALARLGMGDVIRVAIVLREQFWVTDPPSPIAKGRSLRRLSFVHRGDPMMPVCWTLYPAEASVLIAWFGGPSATALLRKPAAEILDRAIAGVARLLHIAPRRMERLVERCHMHDWSSDPYSRGAYSYALVGGAKASAALAKPIDGTLFLAGEAADVEGRNGTVEGAIASGRRAARAALETLRN